MKVGILMLALGVLSTSAFGEDSIPPVQNASISIVKGCGAPPPPGVTATCPTVTTVYFEAETHGICDTFKAETDPVRGGGTMITIIKSTETNCTRPEHATTVERMEVSLGELKGPLYIGNATRAVTGFRE